MITGNDKLSLSILDRLKRGNKPKIISDELSVSYDQVKKLSQLNSLYESSKDNISGPAYDKLCSLGIKALVLKDSIDNNEWEGLEEILGSINPAIKRSDLKAMYPAYKEKKQLVISMKAKAGHKLDELANREIDIATEIEELKKSQNSIAAAIKEFAVYTIDEQGFLLDHIGVANIQNKNIKVLIRRLDYNWQRVLKRDSILTFDDVNYIWVVPDIDKFIAAYRLRLKHKGRVLYDYANVPENAKFNYSTSPYYANKAIKGLNEPLSQKIKTQKERIKSLELEKERINQEINDLKKTDVKTFFDRVEFSNVLSQKELLIHGRLQQMALKYLYQKGNVAAAEVTYKNYRWDTIGFDNERRITIIEVKASANDFLRDSKWKNYLSFCNEFYFLVDSDLAYIFDYREEIESAGAGILVCNKNRIDMLKESLMFETPLESENVIFTINRSICKKLIYGY